jgi:hypothetical protein
VLRSFVFYIDSFFDFSCFDLIKLLFLPQGSMAEMTDKEFNAILREPSQKELAAETSVDETEVTPKGSKVKAKGSKMVSRKLAIDEDNDKAAGAAASSGDESEHGFFCDVCQDGGDLVLCDTCPKSYHQECIKLDTIPDGKWSCPVCVSIPLIDTGSWRSLVRRSKVARIIAAVSIAERRGVASETGAGG